MPWGSETLSNWGGNIADSFSNWGGGGGFDLSNNRSNPGGDNWGGMRGGGNNYQSKTVPKAVPKSSSNANKSPSDLDRIIREVRQVQRSNTRTPTVAPKPTPKPTPTPAPVVKSKPKPKPKPTPVSATDKYKDPKYQAEADILRLREEDRIADENAAAATAAAAAKEAKDRATWNTDLGTSRNLAQSGITSAFKSKGLDPTEYDARIRAALDQAQGGMKFGGSTAFSSDIGNNLLNDLRGEKVRGYQQSVNTFAPEGFEDQAFSSTADDAILDAILNEQYGTASDAVMRSQARGTLNDAGFQYAMGNLDTQKSAAMSRLQGLGGGVLEGYRGELGGIAENARTGAGGWDFGSSYNPDVYKTRLDTRRGELGQTLEGDIRNTVGGEQFFNISDLIAKAGIGQGATNTGLGGGDQSLLGAIQARKDEEAKSRGLGTQGSF